MKTTICLKYFVNGCRLEDFCAIGQKYLQKNTKKTTKHLRKPLEKSEKEYFANLNVNSVPDNKKLWQIVKPLFSSQVKVKTTIELLENYKIVDDKIENTKLF